MYHFYIIFGVILMTPILLFGIGMGFVVVGSLLELPFIIHDFVTYGSESLDGRDLIVAGYFTPTGLFFTFLSTQILPARSFLMFILVSSLLFIAGYLMFVKWLRFMGVIISENRKRSLKKDN